MPAATNRPRRSFLRFGLRSLLGLFTLASLALGYYAAVARQCAEEERALAKLQVFFEEEIFYFVGDVTVPAEPRWLYLPLELSRGEPVQRVEQISLASEQFDDRCLTPILAFRHLKRLSLSGTVVTPSGLAQLRAARPALEVDVPPERLS